MKLYSKGDNFKLYEGNMLEMLDSIAPASVDAVVTDPPYELTMTQTNFTDMNPLTGKCQYLTLSKEATNDTRRSNSGFVPDK